MNSPDAVIGMVRLLSGVDKRKKQDSNATRQANVNPNKHYNHRHASTANDSDINDPSQVQARTRAATMPKARADKAVMTVSRPAIPV